jgi:hypothetical protein
MSGKRRGFDTLLTSMICGSRAVTGAGWGVMSGEPAISDDIGDQDDRTLPVSLITRRSWTRDKHRPPFKTQETTGFRSVGSRLITPGGSIGRTLFCAMGANVALRLRPQFGAYRLFIGPAGNARFGSRLCENSTAFLHGPILFTFSSPQTARKRKIREKLRSARLFAKFGGVFAQPRSRARIAATTATGARLERTPRGRAVV